MKCERCRSYHGQLAEFRIVGEILDIKVCRDCVAEAESLGLRTRRIEGLPPTTEGVAALSQAQPPPM